MRAWWLLPLLVGGCVGDDPDDSDLDTSPWDTDPVVVAGCGPGGEPTLDIGKGERAFVDSEDDDRKSVLIHGLQGGFHSFVSLRGGGLNIDEKWNVVIEGVLDGRIRAVSRLERTPECNPDVDLAEANGTWLIWMAYPEELHGKEVEIRALVVDGDKRIVRDRDTHVIWDPELAGE